MIIRGWMKRTLCVLAVLVFAATAQNNAASEERLRRVRLLGKAFYENPTTQAEAVEQWRRAVELNPSGAADRLNYGLALLRAGRSREGITELEAVQKKDPRIPHTWFNLGIEYKKTGETAKAIRQLEQMVRLLPDEHIAQYNLGVLYKMAGRNEESLAKFRLASKLDPNFAAPHFQLFNAYRTSGKMDEAKRELARFQEIKKKHEEAGTGNEDVEWSVYSEVYETIDPSRYADASAAPNLAFSKLRLPGKAETSSARLVVADFSGTGGSDLAVFSSWGAAFYRKGAAEWAQPAFGELSGIADVVVCDVDNDGFVDLLVLTESGPVLFENEKGKFNRSAMKFPAGRFSSAVWVDYDHDYDMDLLLLGDKSVLLRNQGAAGFQERTSDLPLVSGKAISGVVLRMIPDTKSHDILVTYADRPAVLYRDRLAGVYEAQPQPAIPAGARGLEAADLDHDSAPDVAWKGGAARNADGKFEPIPAWPAKNGFVLADLENRGLSDVIGGGVWRHKSGLGWTVAKAPGLGDGVAFAAADFDGDGRVDLASVGADGSIDVSLNKTQTPNAWIRVGLKGIKNQKLAFGSEVELRAGTVYQKRIYRGSPLLFGVRKEQSVETVRITWPNGLIQNEIRQRARQTYSYEEAQRLSGSCPMIWTWNGSEFEYITDVLGVAPLGASAGDGRYFPVDSDEYIWIGGESLKERDGRLEVRLTEELSEVSYIDQVELIAVDHPAAVSVFTNDKWKSPPFPEFRLFGGEGRVYARLAVEDDGRDVTERLASKDTRYADGFRHDMQGVAEMHSLTLDFGNAAKANRAVLVLNGWVDWADGSTFLAQSQITKEGLVTPQLQVRDANGRWVTVIEDMGMPAGKPKTIAVDLTGKFKGPSREVRIVTNLCVFWDEVFLIEDSGAPETVMTALKPERGDLRFRGFSPVEIHPERKQPERFVYGEPAPSSMWNPTPGMYTRYGDVTELASAIDDKLVIFGSGDELRLLYNASALPALKPGWRRDYLLKVDGWAKDRDANTAHSQTVEPLPFRGMSSYPYPEGESYPDTPEHNEYRRKYNTRPALDLLRPMNRPTTKVRRSTSE